MSPAPKLPKKERFRQILVRLYIEPQAQSELKEALGISKSRLSELVTEMVNRGLIEKKNIIGKTLLFVTEKGKKELFKTKLVSKEDVRGFLERLFRDRKLSYRRNIGIKGINFDFKVIIGAKEVLIKIIDGLIIPDDPAIEQELLELLESAISATRPGKKVMVELGKIIVDLADQKGLLISLMSLAPRLKKKIILIICGTHPKDWTNEFTQKINKLGEIIPFRLLCDIRKRLLSELKHAPKNLTIIHTGGFSLNAFINKLDELLNHK